MTGAELIAVLKNTEATAPITNYLWNKNKATVDPFAMPLDTVADLDSITKTYRWHGMTMTVLNTDTTNIPSIYWFDNNTKEWKEFSTANSGDYDEAIASLQEQIDELRNSSGSTGDYDDTEIRTIINGIQNQIDNLVASAVTYEAGEGIVIADNVISIDPEFLEGQVKPEDLVDFVKVEDIADFVTAEELADALASASTEATEAVNALAEEVEALDNQVSENTSNIQANANSIEALSSATETKVAELELANEANADAIAELQDAISAMTDNDTTYTEGYGIKISEDNVISLDETVIETVNSAITETNEAVANLASEVERVEGIAEEAKTKANEAQADVEAALERVDELEQVIEDFEELASGSTEGAIAEIKEELRGVESQINDLTDEIIAVNEKIDEITADTEALEVKNNEQDEAIEDITNRFNEFESAYTDTVEYVEGLINGLQDKDREQDASIATIQDSLSTITDNVDNINSRLDDLESAFTNTIESEIANLENKINEATEELSANLTVLEGTVDEAKTDIIALNDEIANTNERVSDTEDAIQNLEDEVVEIYSAITDAYQVLAGNDIVSGEIVKVEDIETIVLTKADGSQVSIDASVLDNIYTPGDEHIVINGNIISLNPTDANNLSKVPALSANVIELSEKVENNGKGAITGTNYTEVMLSGGLTTDNVGQIVYLMENDYVDDGESGETVVAGAYIVVPAANGEVDLRKLDTKASGDISADDLIDALETRVSTNEVKIAEMQEQLVWDCSTDEDIESTALTSWTFNASGDIKE